MASARNHAWIDVQQTEMLGKCKQEMMSQFQIIAMNLGVLMMESHCGFDCNQEINM